MSDSEREFPGEPGSPPSPPSTPHAPEGPPADATAVPDRPGRETEMGAPPADSATPAADTTAAPPAAAPAPGPPFGTPEPAGARGGVRTDRVPSITEPTAPRGWDEAVDLERDPAVIPDLAETYVPEALRERIEAAMSYYPDRRSAVIPALHAAQDVHGWCSPEALHQVAAVMRVTPAYLSSIASFYDMLNETPVGRRHVYVCTGVACMPQRPERVLHAIEEEAERVGLEDVEVRHFECLGACDMAPMASVDGRYVGPLDPSDAGAIVAAIRDGETVLPGRGLEDRDYRLPWGGRA